MALDLRDVTPRGTLVPPALAGSGGPAGSAMATCVLMASRAGDADAWFVAGLLARAGIECVILDAGDVGAVRLLVNPVLGTVAIGPREFRPVVTWLRHFAGAAIGSDRPDAATRFTRDSWEALVGDLASLSAVSLPARPAGRLNQLAVAARHGIPIPRTVVVSDPALALPAMTTSLVVVKSTGPHFAEAMPARLSGAFADLVPRESLAARWPAPAVPVIVQEYVPHSAELRVYYASGQIFAFEVSKPQPSALWTHPGDVGASAITTPAAVEWAIVTITGQLGLRYGAFDFLMTPTGPVFLEVNADGDWRWVEILAGTTDVSIAVAAMLARLYRAHGGAARSPGLARFLT